MLRFSRVESRSFRSGGSAAISISPSPSTNGSYTVSWGWSLGCSIQYVYGFPIQMCYELHETVGGQYGTVTNYWTSGTSANISGIASGTYTYTIWAYYSGYPLGEGQYAADGPVNQSVCTTYTVPRYTGWVNGSWDDNSGTCSFYYDGPVQYPSEYDQFEMKTCEAISPLPQNGTMQICS